MKVGHLTHVLLPWCIHDNTDPGDTNSRMLDAVPFDLSQLPALRHFKIQLRSSYDENQDLLGFLTRLFSISSSSSGIETLEIAIAWDNARDGEGENLLSSDAGWSTLDKLLLPRCMGP